MAACGFQSVAKSKGGAAPAESSTPPEVETARPSRGHDGLVERSMVPDSAIGDIRTSVGRGGSCSPDCATVAGQIRDCDARVLEKRASYRTLAYHLSRAQKDGIQG